MVDEQRRGACGVEHQTRGGEVLGGPVTAQRGVVFGQQLQVVAPQ
jgi:hypothetical protein